MTRLLAVAELRLREGLAARLVWLVALAFAVGAGAALWAQGPDAAARAALADRVALSAAWGLAFVVAAVVPALGLPADVRTGAAQTLLSSPVSRLEVLAGGVLGYGALSSLLLVAMAGATTLGMQIAGLGPAQREPLRPSFAAEPVDAAADGRVVVGAAAPEATFRFRVPEGLADGGALRVRMSPRGRVESSWERATTASLSAHRPGAAAAGATVSFKASAAFVALVPLGDLRAGDEAELTFRRVHGGWSLVFGPGSVEVGGARRLWSAGLVTASLCAVPLLLLLAAIGSLGAARFGAPTAILTAAFLLLLVVGRGTIVDGARFIVDSAARQAAGDGHDEHEGHGHAASAQVSPARVAVAKGAIAVFGAVPRLDAFDRTDSLIERRAPAAGDVGRAAAEGLPAAAVLTLAGWLLFRRRELAPG